MAKRLTSEHLDFMMDVTLIPFTAGLLITVFLVVQMAALRRGVPFVRTDPETVPFGMAVTHSYPTAASPSFSGYAGIVG